MEKKFTVTLDETEKGTLIDLLQRDIVARRNYPLVVADLMSKLQATVPDEGTDPE